MGIWVELNRKKRILQTEIDKLWAEYKNACEYYNYGNDLSATRTMEKCAVIAQALEYYLDTLLYERANTNQEQTEQTEEACNEQ